MNTTLIEEMMLEREKAMRRFLSTKHWDKLDLPEVQAGTPITILWVEGLNDDGYLLELPGMSADEGDLFCHIPFPRNNDGVDECPPVWIHLQELLVNDNVFKIMER